MTALQYADDNCSNFRKGICSGLSWRDDGRQIILKELANKPCRLKGRQRCSFFEEALLPAVKLKIGREDRMSKEAKGVLDDYKKMCREAKEEVR